MKIGIGIAFSVMLLLLSGVYVQAGITTDDYTRISVNQRYFFNAPTGTWVNNELDAGNNTYYFRPDPIDVFDLDHSYYFTWFIEKALDSGQGVLSAEIIFNNIYNSDYSTSKLFVNLLDDVTPSMGTNSVDKYYSSDSQVSGDADQYVDRVTGLSNRFNEDDIETYIKGNEELIEVTDNYIPHSYYSRVDLSYTFDSSELIALNDFIADSRFGIGLDPDCHYYNDGIYLKITTAPTGGGGGGVSTVPEPGSVFLLGVGMISLAGWQRRRLSV